MAFGKTKRKARGPFAAATFITPEREVALIAGAQAGERGAMDRLVIAFRPLVVSVAWRFRRYGIDVDDLQQEGFLGFMRAVRKFDATKGLRLGTYAKWWIVASIQLYVWRNYSSVRIKTPNRKSRSMYTLIEARGGFDASLDAPVTESGLTHVNLMVDPAQPVDEVYADRIEQAAKVAELQSRLSELAGRDRAIMRARWPAEGEPATLDTLADRYGVSKQRIQQIEMRALRAIGGRPTDEKPKRVRTTGWKQGKARPRHRDLAPRSRLEPPQASADESR